MTKQIKRLVLLLLLMVFAMGLNGCSKEDMCTEVVSIDMTCTEGVWEYRFDNGSSILGDNPNAVQIGDCLSTTTYAGLNSVADIGRSCNE